MTLDDTVKEDYDPFKRRQCKYYDPDGNLVSLESFVRRDRNLDRIGDDLVGDRRVSTVFIGLDMGGIFHAGLPLIFETMIFCEDNKDPLDLWMDRYCCREHAVMGHDRAVKLAKGELKLDDIEQGY